MATLRVDPYPGFNFLVEIEGLWAGGFTEVTGLGIETEFESYREGGCNGYLHKLPGPTRYPANLVLKRGLIDIDVFWMWHQDVVAGKIERRNGTIFLLNRQHVPITYWNFLRAFPVKWTGPDLRAESSSLAVQTIELVHEGISRPLAVGPVTGIHSLVGG